MAAINHRAPRNGKNRKNGKGKGKNGTRPAVAYAPIDLAPPLTEAERLEAETAILASLALTLEYIDIDLANLGAELKEIAEAIPLDEVATREANDTEDTINAMIDMRAEVERLRAEVTETRRSPDRAGMAMLVVVRYKSELIKRLAADAGVAVDAAELAAAKRLENLMSRWLIHTAR